MRTLVHLGNASGGLIRQTLPIRVIMLGGASFNEGLRKVLVVTLFQQWYAEGTTMKLCNLVGSGCRTSPKVARIG